jgi:hypothetical protein
LEDEPCGDDTNGGCNSTPPVFTELACGQTVCGTAWADGGTRDTDWYSIGATTGQITATLVSSGPGLNFVLTGAEPECTAPSVIGDIGCSENGTNIQVASANEPPGIYTLFVAPGRCDGAGIFEGFACEPDEITYTLTVECDPVGACCVDTTCLDTLTQSECAAEGGGYQGDGSVCAADPSDCCEANDTPGCDDATCEASVCSYDLFCCDVLWDSICAGEAGTDPACADLCTAPPDGGVVCEQAVLTVPLDIKPGACPNPWNRNGRGVLTVAVPGTADFDASQIDVASVRISRADGVGASLPPNEGPPGPHSMLKDIATPFAPSQTCECDHLGADGIQDLSLKFRTDELVEALELYDMGVGEMPELVVTGTLLDGTPFAGSDCVRLVPPGTPPNMLQVSPNAAGAWIDVTPLDDQLDGGGFGVFERTYPQDTEAVLTAEPEMNRRAFLGWRADGGRLVQTDSMTIRVNGHIQTVEAVYADPPRRCGLGWELALLVPPLVWLRARRRQPRSG